MCYLGMAVALGEDSAFHYAPAERGLHLMEVGSFCDPAHNDDCRLPVQQSPWNEHHNLERDPRRQCSQK
jgi:hypothetical protein